MEKVSNEVFIQSVVITVKKDKSVKIALDPRSLNNIFQKEKYQMPNLDNLLKQVADLFNTKEEGRVIFTS